MYSYLLFIVFMNMYELLNEVEYSIFDTPLKISFFFWPWRPGGNFVRA